MNDKTVSVKDGNVFHKLDERTKPLRLKGEMSKRALYSAAKVQ
ncbi:hypothetical protein [Neobacillus sp. FSL H8-0543]